MGCRFALTVDCNLEDSRNHAKKEAKDCIQRKTLCMGPYPAVALNKLFHNVSYLPPPPPPTKGKGLKWARSLLLVDHICICLLIFKTGFLCKQKGEGRGESRPFVFEKTLHGAWALGNPMPELTFFNTTP